MNVADLDFDPARPDLISPDHSERHDSPRPAWRWITPVLHFARTAIRDDDRRARRPQNASPR